MVVVSSKKGIVEEEKKEDKKENKENRIDVVLQKAGKYEIPEGGYRFKIPVYLTEKDGRWLIGEKRDKGKGGVLEHWVEFRMWTYREEMDLKKKATVFDQIKRVHFMDQDLLNRLKIQNLMTAWSFENDNSRLKLLHVNGILVDESYAAFMNMYPVVVRYIIEEMNGVLEYNQ